MSFCNAPLHSNELESQTVSTGERNTYWVIALTLVTMVVEIITGLLFGSMALLADGWHMGTHVAALSITVFTYHYARRYAHHPQYSFGTGKVGVLGGFASAVALGVVALLMIVESIQRLLSPHPIHFDGAILVAVIGLIVNLVSAAILHDNHDHNHHHDHNLKAAYFHVLADALTSLLAIIALTAGKLLNWIWLDATMGIVGSFIIMRWAYNLMRENSYILLDSSNIDPQLAQQIRTSLESEGDNQVTDLHSWRINPQQSAIIITLISSQPQPPSHYKKLLSQLAIFEHITIEVNPRPTS